MEYIEKQRLKLWWLYLLVGLESIIILSIILFDKGGMSYQQLKSIYFAPIFGIVLPFIVAYLITQNELILSINEKGIHYHYRPFGKVESILWNEIEALYLRKFDALSEYGGWGVKRRLWFKFKDKAYIFNDKNIGLQLILHNERKVLFSTAKADELALFLINLKRQYSIGAIETDVRERER